MTERTILERLKEGRVVNIYRGGPSSGWKWGIDGWGSTTLTRAELIQLADEIRELAGEDFDHG